MPEIYVQLVLPHSTEICSSSMIHTIMNLIKPGIHTVLPNQREWLSVLVCINAAGDTILNFYIFKGKCFDRNYIEKCEFGATMAMQSRAWMT